MSRFPGIPSMLALAAAVLVVLPVAAHAKRIARPPVPGDLQPPAGHEPYLVGHAVGTQNYVCVVSPTGAQTWRSSARRRCSSTIAASRSRRISRA